MVVVVVVVVVVVLGSMGDISWIAHATAIKQNGNFHEHFE